MDYLDQILWNITGVYIFLRIYFIQNFYVKWVTYWTNIISILKTNVIFNMIIDYYFSLTSYTVFMINFFRICVFVVIYDFLLSLCNIFTFFYKFSLIRSHIFLFIVYYYYCVCRYDWHDTYDNWWMYICFFFFSNFTLKEPNY